MASATTSAKARDLDKVYNRRVRNTATVAVGDLVRVLKLPRDQGITKLAHEWLGPERIKEDAGFDNWRVVREDTNEHLVVHCSLLMMNRCACDSLGHVVERIIRVLAEEDEVAGTKPQQGRRLVQTIIVGYTAVPLKLGPSVEATVGQSVEVSEATDGMESKAAAEVKPWLRCYVEGVGPERRYRCPLCCKCSRLGTLGNGPGDECGIEQNAMSGSMKLSTRWFTAEEFEESLDAGKVKVGDNLAAGDSVS
ncbi:LOW QUALITY PROTEIN: hypothetical protein PHMEG_00019460 [Phytophthora megakarya]|uniref:Uncharacterized protein n=1 Tax=Phytophthora megakarya TaxID=4795 RepID=A0A225VT13_9STRA|nr:LOW QUALITY PROTEIN: hypothetical protein PHMEG_00019460 [Phytophthora megakarya]